MKSIYMAVRHHEKGDFPNPQTASLIPAETKKLSDDMDKQFPAVAKRFPVVRIAEFEIKEVTA